MCLGHQAIGQVFGSQLVNLATVYHGVATSCHLLADDYLFAGLPETVTVGRYHSWVVDGDTLPDCLEITARSDEGQVMALRHRLHDVRGIQFHPESILTPDGKTMLRNWIEH